MYSNWNVIHNKYIVLYISNGYLNNHHKAFKYINMVLYVCYYSPQLSIIQQGFSALSLYVRLKTIFIVQNNRIRCAVFIIMIILAVIHFRVTIRDLRVEERESKWPWSHIPLLPSWEDINTDWRDSSSCALRHSIVLRNGECVEQKGGMKKDRQGWELSCWISRTAPNMRLLEVLREMCIQLRFAATVHLNQAAICLSLQATIQITRASKQNEASSQWYFAKKIIQSWYLLNKTTM